MLSELDDVRFEKIDGVWLPVEATIVHDNTWKGLVQKAKIHHKRTAIQLNPDHEALGSFSPSDIRNGAPTFLVPFDNIIYRWQDGKLVTNAD